MTPAPDTPASLQRRLDRRTLRCTAEAMIDGTGLRIQELTRELVIFNPSDPEKGRVHIEYSNGYVSWERIQWDHWGLLQGYPDDEDTARPHIGAAQILTTLGITTRPTP